MLVGRAPRQLSPFGAELSTLSVRGAYVVARAVAQRAQSSSKGTVRGCVGQGEKHTEWKAYRAVVEVCKGWEMDGNVLSGIRTCAASCRI